MCHSILASMLLILILLLVLIISLHPFSSSSSSSFLPAILTNTNTKGGELFPRDSTPFGLTYGEWTARWWQWAYSIPKNVHPAYDVSGNYCTEGQSGPVWFLAGTFEHPVERYCTIAANKAILIPILNSECSYAEFPSLINEEQLRQCAKKIQDSVIHLEASIDGVPVTGLDRYRVQSQLFNLTLVQNNILDLPANTTTQAIADGNWLFLKPLSTGDHVIYFKGGLGARNTTTANNNATIDPFAGPYGWDRPVTYHIKITNSSSPYSTPAHLNQTNAEK